MPGDVDHLLEFVRGCVVLASLPLTLESVDASLIFFGDRGNGTGEFYLDSCCRCWDDSVTFWAAPGFLRSFSQIVTRPVKDRAVPMRAIKKLFLNMFHVFTKIQHFGYCAYDKRVNLNTSSPSCACNFKASILYESSKRQSDIMHFFLHFSPL